MSLKSERYAGYSTYVDPEDARYASELWERGWSMAAISHETMIPINILVRYLGVKSIKT